MEIMMWISINNLINPFFYKFCCSLLFINLTIKSYFHEITCFYTSIHTFRTTHWFHLIWDNTNSNSDFTPKGSIINLNRMNRKKNTWWAIEGVWSSPRSHFTRPPYKLLQALPLAIRVILFNWIASSGRWLIW